VRRLLAVVAGLGVLSQTSLAFAQCAMCKTLLTNSPEGRALSGRFNIAILVMLVAPYLVTTGVLLALFRHRVRNGVEGAGLVVRQLFVPRSEKHPA
jgi:hypothetical protein